MTANALSAPGRASPLLGIEKYGVVIGCKQNAECWPLRAKPSACLGRVPTQGPGSSCACT